MLLLQLEHPLLHGKHKLLLGSSMNPSPQFETQSLFRSNGNWFPPQVRQFPEFSEQVRQFELHFLQLKLVLSKKYPSEHFSRQVPSSKNAKDVSIKHDKHWDGMPVAQSLHVKLQIEFIVNPELT